MLYRLRWVVLVVSALGLSATGQIKGTRIEINTIGGSSDIRVLLILDMPAGFEVDDQVPTAGAPQFLVKSLNDDRILGSESRVEYRLGSRRYALELKISGFGKDLIDNLSAGRVGYYVFVQDTVTVNLKNANLQRKQLLLSPQIVREKTAGKTKLSDGQAEMIIGAKGGEAKLYGNKFDVGRKVDLKDSAKASYVASFSVAQPFLFSDNILSFKGSIGTDADDPLNKVSIYPVGIEKSFSMPAVGYPSKIKSDLGFEASENLDVRRASVSVAIQSITPNLINLSYGEGRLRLKPVVCVGVKGLFEATGKKINNGKDRYLEVFSEMYYYVPVMKIYSLLFEGNAYWINDGSNKVKGKLDITLGADIEGTGFKVMAKYSTGQNDVNIIRDDRLVLGLLMDLFESK